MSAAVCIYLFVFIYLCVCVCTGQDCFQYQQDGHTFLSCNMRRDQLEQRGSPSELLLDLQSLLHTVESEALRLGQHVLKRKPLLMSQVPQITPLHPAKTYRYILLPVIYSFIVTEILMSGIRTRHSVSPLTPGMVEGRVCWTWPWARASPPLSSVRKRHSCPSGMTSPLSSCRQKTKDSRKNSPFVS